MKFLDSERLKAVNNALDLLHIGDCKVESYSCKSTTNDKRMMSSMLSREPGSTPGDLQALSPPESWFAGSPLRRHRFNSGSSMEEERNPFSNDTISRKTLFFLTQTLNAAFAPDYDFSTARGEDFSKEPKFDWVMANIDSCLFQTSGQGQVHVDLQQELWAAIDEEIDVKNCEIFSYNPDLSGGDPFSEDGCLWSFNYFFYNQKIRRVLFFTARAMSTRSAFDSGMGTDEDDEDDCMFYEE